MAIQRWEPLRDLMQIRESMNRMFEDAMTRSAGGGVSDVIASTAWQPPVDLFEQANQFVLRADLPGVAASDVEVRIEKGRLLLRGQRREDETVAREAYLRVERPSGAFTLQMALPPSIDRERIQAKHRNGVLEVLLPKKREDQVSRIDVGND